MILVSTHSRPKAAGKPTFARASLILFQLTAARRRLARLHPLQGFFTEFQLTAARRRLDADLFGNVLNKTFQLTAARRRLVAHQTTANHCLEFQLTAARRRLEIAKTIPLIDSAFQLTAARRRLATERGDGHLPLVVSTHSRPKAAGIVIAEVVAG